MTYTQRQIADDRHETRCDRCGHGTTSRFVEVLQAWTRTHVCPKTHRQTTTRTGGAR